MSFGNSNLEKSKVLTIADMYLWMKKVCKPISLHWSLQVYLYSFVGEMKSPNQTSPVDVIGPKKSKILFKFLKPHVCQVRKILILWLSKTSMSQNILHAIQERPRLLVMENTPILKWKPSSLAKEGITTMKILEMAMGFTLTWIQTVLPSQSGLSWTNLSMSM